MLTEKEINLLIDSGYARTSNRYGMISRIDRKNWKEYMAKQHSPWNIKAGMEWVDGLGARSAADFYRRVHSQDALTVGAQSKNFPPSDSGPDFFKPKNK